MDHISGSLKTGEVLRGRYRISDILGEGAHGRVYLADDLVHLGATWAVKEMFEGNLTDEEREEALDRFSREIMLLKKLNHPGIPKFIDSFSLGPHHYIVMEYVDGITLEASREEKPPDEKTVLEWAVKICGILSYLHTLEPQPIIFRDLKPGNIMIAGKGRILLIDFGIARFFNPVKEKDTTILGTPGFSPPEQYGKAQSDPRSDIYSLGATVYFLLTGEDLARFSFKVPPITAIKGSVSPGAGKILERCLAIDPELRYQEARDLKSDLNGLIISSQETAMPQAPHPLPPSHASLSSGASSSHGQTGSASSIVVPKSFASGIAIAAALAVLMLLVILIYKGSPQTHMGGTPDLCAKIKQNNLTAVLSILKENPSLANIPDVQGFTPLHYAIQTENARIVGLLLDNGADINGAYGADNFFPLYDAASNGYKDMAKLLIEQRADIDRKCKGGFTPLMGAVNFKQEAIAELLIEKGANIKAHSDDGGTAFLMAVKNSQWKTADLLIKKGADVDGKIGPRQVPFIMFSAANNRIEELEYLLSKGANVNAREGTHGSTALMQAAWLGNDKVITILLNHGADLEARDKRGKAALHAAAWRNKASTVGLLIDNGANPEAKENDGWTPLHNAAHSGSLEAASMLIEKGARVNLRDKAGETPIDLALKQGQVKIADLLRQHGSK